MSERCVNNCFYYAEGMDIYIKSDDPAEVAQAQGFLEAGELCRETPKSGSYKNCGYLAAAKLAVQLQDGEPNTNVMGFYTEFFVTPED